MTNNIQMPITSPTVVKTTDNGGVHTTHHNVDNTVLAPNGAQADLQAAGNATLVSMLAAIRAQRVESIWTDDTGTRFIRVVTEDAIYWTDVDGNASSPPGAGRRPDNDSASTVSRQTFRATATATGYSTGDYIDHFVVNDETGDLVGNFWVNITAGTKIAAPNPAHITVNSVLPDNAATQTTLEAVRVLLTTAATAGNQGTANTTLASILAGMATAAAQANELAALQQIAAAAQSTDPTPVQTSRKPLTYTNVSGSPFTLTSNWQKVATVAATTTNLAISPIAAATAFDIELAFQPAGTSGLPADVNGTPIFAGWDGGGGDRLELGDVYAKSASGQTAIVRIA